MISSEDVVSGDLSVKDFLMRYAAYCLGINNLDDPIEVDPFLIKEVESTQNYLEELQSLNQDELAKRTEEWNVEVRLYLESLPSEEELGIEQERIADLMFMLSEAYSDDDDIEKLITNGSSFLHAVHSGLTPYYHEGFSKILTPKEWKTKFINDVSTNLQVKIQNLQSEMSRVEELNVEIKRLKELINANF